MRFAFVCCGGCRRNGALDFSDFELPLVTHTPPQSGMRQRTYAKTRAFYTVTMTPSAYVCRSLLALLRSGPAPIGSYRCKTAALDRLALVVRLYCLRRVIYVCPPLFGRMKKVSPLMLLMLSDVDEVPGPLHCPLSAISCARLSACCLWRDCTPLLNFWNCRMMWRLNLRFCIGHYSRMSMYVQ